MSLGAGDLLGAMTRSDRTLPATAVTLAVATLAVETLAVATLALVWWVPGMPAGQRRAMAPTTPAIG
jgi:hypothetical protein